MRMSVTERVTRTSDKSLVVIHYDMSVESARDGLRIAFSNVRVDPSTVSTSLEELAASQQRLQPGLRQDYLVSSAGVLTSVTFDPTRAEAVLALPQPEQSFILDAMVTQSSAMAKDDWDDLVGQWTNRAFTAEPIAVEQIRDAHIEEEAAFDAKLSFGGYVPCASREGKCAKLLSDGKLRPRPEGETQSGSGDAHRRLEVVTDPETLLPYASLLDVEMSLTVPGSTPLHDEIRVERTFTYR